jgi:hypothetical protein
MILFVPLLDCEIKRIKQRLRAAFRDAKHSYTPQSLLPWAGTDGSTSQQPSA